MVDVDQYGTSVLMKELKESFHACGHTELEWRELTERPELPDWARWWISPEDHDQAKKLQVALGSHSHPYTMLEIEVRDDGGETTGRALMGVREIKTNAGHYVAKAQFLAATDATFADWGSLHFNEFRDFDLHFCRRVANECTMKCRSKTIGWFHVSCFRVLDMMTAIHHEYAANESIQYFSEFLQKYMEDKGQAAEIKSPRAQDKREVLEDRFSGPGGALGSSAKTGRADPAARKAVAEMTARADAARLARESAEAATRALVGGNPQLVEKVKLVARRDEGRGFGGTGSKARHSFLDEIPEDSIDGVPWSQHSDRERDRQRSRSRAKDRTGGDDKKDKKDSKDKKKKKKSKSRGRSSSPGRREASLRGRNVVAPVKIDRKKPKRDKGDPSSDPDDSGDGGGKKGGKKRKRSSSSSSATRAKKDKKLKKKIKEKKKKKGKGSSSSSTSGDSKDDLYGKETAKFESLVEKSRRHPGRLLRSGLEQMSKYLAARTGNEGGPAVSWRDQRVGAYLNQVLFNQHPPNVIGVRNTRELVTLAEAIDLLMEERLPNLGDLLMQRLKAVEASLSEGWSVASFQELIPPSRATLTTDQERAFAARHALQQRKLSDAVKKKTV